jgi:hypothetical protein
MLWDLRSSASIGAFVPGGAASLASGTLTAAGGAIVTIALLGRVGGGSSSLLECLDNAGSSGSFASCAVLPQ